MSLTPLSAMRDRLLSTITVPAECDQVLSKRVLREWLVRVCRELDLRLDAPISQTRMGLKRTVTVFRVLQYTINRATRTVECHVSAPAGRLAPRTVELDLWHPIRKNFWIPWLLSDMGLFQPGPQDDLFQAERTACMRWLADTAFSLLQRDPRFRTLRDVTLPAALGLDPRLVAVALRSRSSPLAPPLTSSLYTRVWRSKAAFVETDRENPRLLPLLEAWLRQHGRLSLGRTPMSRIKHRFRKEGVGEAGWRYLCRHGARIFRTLWELTPHLDALDVACLYLLRLQQAGLPPPPSPLLLRAWSTETDLYDDLFFEENWETETCEVFGIGLREANQIKGTAGYQRFIEDFNEVVLWARTTALRLDKNQRRTGWPWLVRKARERRLPMIDRPPRYQWNSLIGGFDLGQYRVVPLIDDVMLRDEAIEMRNCIHLYSPDALTSKVRLFSIRRCDSGKCIADVELRYAPRRSRWVVVQTAGKANRSAPHEIDMVVPEIERRYNEVQAGCALPDFPEDVSLKPGSPAEAIAHRLERLAQAAD